MGQKIASLYAEIGGDVSKLQKALGIAKSELKGTKSGFSEIIRETTGFNLSTLTAAAGVGILTKGFVDAINKTVAYNRQIREMSEFTGMGVEDTSRLVQVADDWATAPRPLPSRARPCRGRRARPGTLRAPVP